MDISCWIWTAGFSVFLPATWAVGSQTFLVIVLCNQEPRSNSRHSNCRQREVFSRSPPSDRLGIWRPFYRLYTSFSRRSYSLDHPCACYKYSSSCFYNKYRTWLTSFDLDTGLQWTRNSEVNQTSFNASKSIFEVDWQIQIDKPKVAIRWK